MTYQVRGRSRGRLWEHRAIVGAVCLLIIAANAVLVGPSRVPFLPLGMLLLAAGMVAFLVVVALVLLWLSTTASDLPHDAEPTV